MTVLTPQNAHYIRHYKYVGTDASPTFKYLLSPFAQKMVDLFIPLWMAPNVVTSLGLLCSFVSCTLTMIYNPSLEVGGPRWLHILTGICLFGYQTLDNMDGKQARKTGSSSALGMVFDHGCDAINSGVSLLAVASVMGTGWSGKLLLTYVSTMAAFYFQTWEEYYTGAMTFAFFNGPTEGLLMAAIMCLLSGIFGNENMHTSYYEIPESILPPHTYFFGGLSLPSKVNNQLTPFLFVQFVICATLFFTILNHLIKVGMVCYEKKMSLFSAYFNLFPFLLMMFSFYVHAMESPVVFKTTFAVKLLFAINTCCTFMEQAVHLMVSHIIHREMSPLTRWPTWLLFGLMLFTVYGPQYGIYTPEREVAILGLITVYSFFTSTKQLIQTFTGFADVLGIYIFSLEKKRVQ